MSIFQSFLLGALQGVGEFLPISSSGHLAVIQNLFSLDNVPLLFDVFLHLSTLVAVLLFFRKKIYSLILVLWRWLRRKSLPEDSSSLQMIIALLIGTFITGIFGIFLSDLIPNISIKMISIGFIVTALFLLLADYIEGRRLKKNTESESTSKNNKTVTAFQGLCIGFAQGIGVLPGISRSGSTIAGALLCGVDRKTAGEFSFLLSIPAILGAFIFELDELDTLGTMLGFTPLFVGCLSAFIFGFISLSILMKIIRNGKLGWFAVYLIPVGIIGLLFL